MNNREWLYGMEPSDLAAWFDAERVEPNDGIKPDNPYVGLVRGKQWERTEISDYYCGRCGWKVTDHDSYCPECGGALHKTSNKPDDKFDARKTAETPETDTSKCDIRDFDDSREKLEADKIEAINSFLREHHGAISWNDELRLMSDEWLDRQAAITEEQTRYKWVTASAYEIAELQRERDDLKAQMDEILAGDKAADAINAELAAKVKDLENQVEVWMDAAANAHDMWEKADSRRVEVERECDSLVIDLADCERVIADLRGKLSRACDNAHDTLRIMDEGLA